MITVKEMIAALQTLEAEGKGDHPVIVTHWLGGYEPAGLPGLIDVIPTDRPEAIANAPRPQVRRLRVVGEE